MLDNKYSRIYTAITSNAKQRGLDKQLLTGYYEKHHILPRSLGGCDDATNLVLLTAKEHYVCHHLLTKMTEGFHKELMKHAFGFMCNAANRYQPRHNATQYGIRREMSTTRSPEWIANIQAARAGWKPTAEQNAANSARLTGRKLSDSHKENIRAAAEKRGFSDNARRAKLASIVRTYNIIHPNGHAEQIVNLKQWCIDRGFNYGSAANNCKHPNPIRSGTMQGYKFSRCI